MRTKTITLYKFDELSEQAQEDAIGALYDINVDHEWWDYIYEDAERAGIKLTEFDLDHGMIKGKMIFSLEDSIKAILSDHGNECDTYKTAKCFEKLLNDMKQDDDYEDELENLTSTFLHDILEDYRIRLRKEYEYMTSREAIIETIKANEYEFTETGKLE